MMPLSAIAFPSAMNTVQTNTFLYAFSPPRSNKMRSQVVLRGTKRLFIMFALLRKLPHEQHAARVSLGPGSPGLH